MTVESTAWQTTSPLALRRTLQWALMSYLVLAWFGGGATVDVTHADEILAALALPLLLLSILTAVLSIPGRDRQPAWLWRVALVVAGLLLAIPLFQLLPVPSSLWYASPARIVLAEELAIAGVEPVLRWSLWPLASERAAYALLPALAVFMGAWSLGAAARRLLLQVALGVILANLFFGLFQAGLPPQSPLRLYQGNGTGFGGVLVNGNHQGTALLVGMLLALGLWAAERQRHGRTPSAWKRAAYGVSAVVCLAAIPLAGASAPMLLALPALVAGVLATGLLSRRRMRSQGWARGAAVALIAVMVFAVFSALQWIDVRESDAERFALARDVVAAGVSQAPTGSGAGTFVQAFAQSGAPSLRRGEYINHAHNEYAQWWFEAGWAGVLAMLSALALFLACGARLLRTQHRDPTAIACWLAVAVMLVHSWVDFPLRTLSLMTMSGLLMGAVLAAVGTHAGSRRLARHSDAMPEAA